MPIRKIPKSYRNITGLVASNKNKRMAGFKSSVERDLILLIEFDLNVEYYEEQLVVIDYIDSKGLSSITVYGFVSATSTRFCQKLPIFKIGNKPEPTKKDVLLR